MNQQRRIDSSTEDKNAAKVKRARTSATMPTPDAESGSFDQPVSLGLPPVGDRLNRGTLPARQARVLRMQQQFGNRAVRRMIASTRVQRADDDSQVADTSTTSADSSSGGGFLGSRADKLLWDNVNAIPLVGGLVTAGVDATEGAYDYATGDSAMGSKRMDAAVGDLKATNPLVAAANSYQDSQGNLSDRVDPTAQPEATSLSNRVNNAYWDALGYLPGDNGLLAGSISFGLDAGGAAVRGGQAAYNTAIGDENTAKLRKEQAASNGASAVLDATGLIPGWGNIQAAKQVEDDLFGKSGSSSQDVLDFTRGAVNEVVGGNRQLKGDAHLGKLLGSGLSSATASLEDRVGQISMPGSAGNVPGGGSSNTGGSSTERPLLVMGPNPHHKVDVYELQYRLNYYVDPTGQKEEFIKMDGIFGPDTLWCLKMVQDIMEVKSDGKAGPETWTALLLPSPYLQSQPTYDLKFPDIESGTPAAAAGMKKGEQLTKVDGIQMHSDRQFDHIIRGHNAGDAIVIETIGADQTPQRYAVTLGNRGGAGPGGCGTERWADSATNKDW